MPGTPQVPYHDTEVSLNTDMETQRRRESKEKDG